LLLGFEADPSADEEEEGSEGGRLRRRSASDGGEGIPPSPLKFCLSQDFNGT